MSLLQIVCENCGAKYRLPETFSGERAKCKQCSHSIDVASQRQGAAAPAAAAARPASARPAAARPASARSEGARASSRSARREPVEEEPKKSNAPVIFGGIGGVAVLVVIAVFALGGGDKNKTPAKKADNAKAPAAAPATPKTEPPKPTEASAPRRPVADEAPASPVGASASKPAAPTAPQGQKPTDKPADKPAAGKPAAKSAEATKDALHEEREKLVLKDLDAWKKLQVKSLADIFDVKGKTKAIPYPAEVTDEVKAKLTDEMQKAKDGGGGARTSRALKAIEKMGFPALLFLVNSLRDVDYKSVDETMFAFQLNQTLTTITLGVNTGFVPVELGEEMDPRKAHWNAMTVKQWIEGVQLQWPTKAKFDEYIDKRKAKKDAEAEADLGGK